MRKASLGTLFMLVGISVVASNSYALDLSLNDAVDRIVAESQDLKKADANIKKAEAALDSVNANRWMKIDGTATYMNLVNVANPGESYAVDLPPELGGCNQSA